MKMKKVGRLLSLVVAGAMALSMIPAAFAADDDTAHVEPTSSCFHDHMTYVSNGDGTHQEICDDCGVTLELQKSCMYIDGKCKDCDAPDPTCEHEHQSPVDNGDGTCSYVCDNCNIVIDTMEHIFQNGACVRCKHPEPACQHMNQNFKFVANNNGTHDVLCGDCDATLSENVPCTYVDGKCQQCGATCDHMANSWEYESTDHGTHKVICAVCKAVVDELGCTYVNGKCQTCGAEEPACDHMNQNFEFSANNDRTHNVLCGDCKAVLSENVPCTFVNGKCEQCGAACDHMGQKFEFSANNDGTHNVLCGDCKAVLSENVPCTYVDGKCEQCGAEKPACDHMGQNFKFVANNDDTHNVLCADCDAVLSENVPCTYIDGKCQQCGAVCQHVKQHAVDNEDGTCSYVCDKCNTVIDTVAHIYYDGEDTCARCGAGKAACKHLNENYEYVDNGNGTHNVVCADCGAVAQENVACDYILDECVHCGGLYAGGNVPFFVSTGKGLLRSLRSFFMSLFIR